MTARARAFEIVSDVALAHGITPTDIFYGRSRRRSAVLARHEAYRAVRALGFSYPELGEFFNRDHTTILYACRKGHV